MWIAGGNWTYERHCFAYYGNSVLSACTPLSYLANILKPNQNKNLKKFKKYLYVSMFVGSGGMSMHVYMDTLCPHIGFHVVHAWICVCYQSSLSVVCVFMSVVCGFWSVVCKIYFCCLNSWHLFCLKTYRIYLYLYF